jgi:hypothetical protein
MPTLRPRNGSGSLGCGRCRTGAVLVRCSRRDYGRRCEVPSGHVDNDSWSRSRDLRGPRVQQAVHFVSILPNTGACGFGVAPDAGGGCHRVRGCALGRYDFVALIEKLERALRDTIAGIFWSVLWYSQGSGGVRTTAGNGQ